LKSNSTVIISDKDKAETLNSYFFSVFTREQLPSPSMGQSPYKPITDLQISLDGVAKLRATFINPQKACGPDKIPARVLKQIAQSVSPWLAFIFQQSFDHNAIPTNWSQALVTAVLKNNSKSNPAKIIGQSRIGQRVFVVLSHMAKHLSANNILIDEQHGFRKNRSCETQLISMIVILNDSDS
jgi:hypothetical protein